MSDLICLVADKNMAAAIAALLERHQALRIRPISFELHVHPQRDPGVFLHGVEFVRPLQNRFQHALLMLDAAWEGAPLDAERKMEHALARAGLSGWARVIVIVPELDVWVWSASPHVEEALGWSGRNPSLRCWLEQNGLWRPAEDPKPQDPKNALERALREVRKPRSSSIYRTLARIVSIEHCHDSAFLHLRSTLQEWFGKSA